ncbi:MAG TPA: alpha/beta fold hydrolase [Longimicrobiales bacterium]|nr:alpha/beta fold hydrolase [Longimicrobiales bacterium]
MIRLPFTREPRPGDTLRGDIRIPDGPPPRAAVVLAHGFKGFKDWGFFPWVAEQLVGAGYAVVTFNFSRNGIAGDPVRITDLDRFASNTLSLEQEELRAVLAEVLDGDLLPRRPRRAALLGHSRGGGHAVLASAAEPRVGALVTWAAVAHFDRWTEETRALWRAGGRIWVLNQRNGEQMPVGVELLEDFEAHRVELDVRAAASRITAPWLIIHGTEDLTVWPGDAHALVRANPGAGLHRVEGAGHTLEVGHPFGGVSPELREAMDRTLEHLRRHLEP